MAILITYTFFMHFSDFMITIYPKVMRLCGFNGDNIDDPTFKLKMALIFIYVGHNIYWILT